MFQHCLICTDFLDGLHRLTHFVPNLAIGGLKRIVFLHSFPIWEGTKVAGVDEEKIATAKERLQSQLPSIPEGVEVKIEVLSGNPVETISRIAKTYDIDVIVVGMSTRSALEEKLFGSTTKELVKVTSIPLMILRPQLISTYTDEELALRCQHLWRYLLIPYNDNEASQNLLKQIKVYTQKQSGKFFQYCILSWIIDEVGRESVITTRRLQEAQEKLQSVKTDLERLGLEVEVKVRQGNPVRENLELAFDFDISAIAVTDYRSNLLEWTVPSPANELLRRSWFPILFFSAKNPQ